VDILLSGVILAVTLAFILVRPRNISEALAASVGGLLVVALGLVSISETVEILDETSNVLIFLVGMMTVSGIAERAGFFTWAGNLAIRVGRGSVFRLYLAIFAIGTAVTITLSLDATAIVLTPVVFGMVRTLGIKPIPFMFACVYTANTGSLLLPVSNLTNLLVYEAFSMDLLRFALIMIFPAAFAIVTNLLIFVLLFREDIRGTYTRVDYVDTINVPAFFRFATFCLAAVLISIVIASLMDIPIGLVALTGSLIATVIARIRNWMPVRDVANSVSWRLLPLVVGLFLVVRAVQNAGFEEVVQSAFLRFEPGEGFLQILFIAAGTAIGSNLINNVPMTVLLVNDLSPLVADGSMSEISVYAALIGTNVGPNLTVVGSLATLIWLGIIRGRGMRMTARDYLAIGIATTPPVMLAACFGLWLAVQVFAL